MARSHNWPWNLDHERRCKVNTQKLMEVQTTIKKRRQESAEFKFKVALEAAKGKKTIILQGDDLVEGAGSAQAVTYRLNCLIR